MRLLATGRWFPIALFLFGCVRHLPVDGSPCLTAGCPSGYCCNSSFQCVPGSQCSLGQDAGAGDDGAGSPVGDSASAPDAQSVADTAAPAGRDGEGGEASPPLACMQRDRHGWTFVVDDLRATTQTILHQNAFGEPTVALTTADRLVLAWVENSKKRAVQWTPESCGFDQLGIARAANEVVLAADRRGNLFMASAGDEGQIVVERWSGQAWVPFGPAMPVKVGIIWELGLQLELDPSGLPVATWLQGDSVQVARWTADAVHRLTDDSGILGSIRLPGVRRPLSLAVAPDGTIVVGWRNISGEPTVGRFDGSRWKQVGGALPGVPGSFGDMGYLNAPVVQVSGNGDLYVAWAGRRIFPENYRTFVARWDGNSWVPVGDFLSSNLLSLGTHDLWMALDTRSRPVVVAAEEIRTGVSRLFTYAWDGAAWTTPAQPLDGQEFETTVGWPRITVDSRGRWLVSWFQSPGDGLLAVYLARFAP